VPSAWTSIQAIHSRLAPRRTIYAMLVIVEARQREPAGHLITASAVPWRPELLQSTLDHSEVLEDRISRLSRIDARCGP
jgi:hypothetical protein